MTNVKSVKQRMSILLIGWFLGCRKRQRWIFNLKFIRKSSNQTLTNNFLGDLHIHNLKNKNKFGNILITTLQNWLRGFMLISIYGTVQVKKHWLDTYLILIGAFKLRISVQLFDRSHLNLLEYRTAWKSVVSKKIYK